MQYERGQTVICIDPKGILAGQHYEPADYNHVTSTYKVKIVRLNERTKNGFPAILGEFRDCSGALRSLRIAYDYVGVEKHNKLTLSAALVGMYRQK